MASDVTDTHEQPSNTVDFSFDLPPFPTTATQLVTELNEPEVQVASIIQLIECEPTVAAKVLQLANSPIYGATRAITTIGHAIVILGFKSVAQLALTVATGTVFDGGDAACKDQRKATFTQSLAVASLARTVAKQSRSANPDEAFLCGVMHDIGKLILFDAASSDYLAIVENEPSGNTTASELALFGTTHPELGATCGKHWGLPSPITAAIGKHHDRLAQTADALTTSVISANHLARHWGIGFEPAAKLDCEDELSAVASVDPDIEAECREQFSAICEICLT